MPAAVDPEIALQELLGRIAPGTALRDGLERILAGRTGALIVLGYYRVVDSLCTGASPSTSHCRPPACGSWRRWTAR